MNLMIIINRESLITRLPNNKSLFECFEEGTLRIPSK